MTDNFNIKDWYSMSDVAILRELGQFIRESRLKKNYTQTDLSEKAGIHRVTLSEFEHGLRGSLTTFIQVLRALEELETLNTYIVSTEISPLLMARLEAKKRKRASTTRVQPPVNKKSLSSKKRKAKK